MKVPIEYKQMEFKNLLIELVKLFKPKTYMEIGVKKGYTFNAIAPLVQRAIAVDINPFTPMYKDNTQFYNLSSFYFYKLWKEKESNSIDFLFIDANHKYDAVLLDFFRFSSFVPLHTGLIFLHDTYPIKEELLSDGYCSTAWKAAKAIHKIYKNKFEIVTLPGPWAGLSIIRKIAEDYKTSTHGWMDKFVINWINDS
jgi:predicted O-methyltransferase YrrM